MKINDLSLKLVNKLIENKDTYGVNVIKLKSGATVLDCTNGSWIAGKLVSEICMGGLGSVEFSAYNLDEHYLPAVNVYTSEPIISCMASQLAGWSVKLKKDVEKDGEIKSKVVFQALGSGPARAKAKGEKIFEELNFNDDSDCAVLVFETRKIPDEEVVAIISNKCKVDSKKTYAIAAPTACLVGSIQVSARIIETGIHKLHELHFPLNVIKNGFGTSPIAPIAKDDIVAMGTTNDSIIAAGRTYYNVNVEKEKEDKLFELLKKAPANSSSSYGKPFNDIFKEVNFDFYKIDPALFAPASITVNNVQTGKTITVGKINHQLLKKSYGLA